MLEYWGIAVQVDRGAEERVVKGALPLVYGERPLRARELRSGSRGRFIRSGCRSAAAGEVLEAVITVERAVPALESVRLPLRAEHMFRPGDTTIWGSKATPPPPVFCPLRLIDSVPRYY